MYVATMTSLAQGRRGQGHDDARSPRSHAPLRPGARRTARPGARRPARGRIRVLPARHREGGRARGGAVQARSARRGRVDGDARAPVDRGSDRVADPIPRGRCGDRAEPPRAMGRARLPEGAPCRGDPACGQGLRDRRLLRRDDERPAVPSRDAHRAGARGGAGGGRQPVRPRRRSGVPRPGARGRAPARPDRCLADRSRPSERPDVVGFSRARATLRVHGPPRCRSLAWCAPGSRSRCTSGTSRSATPTAGSSRGPATTARQVFIRSCTKPLQAAVSLGGDRRGASARPARSR